MKLKKKGGDIYYTGQIVCSPHMELFYFVYWTGEEWKRSYLDLFETEAPTQG